jgi:hypothetical protein
MRLSSWRAKATRASASSLAFGWPRWTGFRPIVPAKHEALEFLAKALHRRGALRRVGSATVPAVLSPVSPVVSPVFSAV